MTAEHAVDGEGVGREIPFVDPHAVDNPFLRACGPERRGGCGELLGREQDGHVGHTGAALGYFRTRW
ncbi:hypothetical protein FB389_0516 [Rarobacter incanus]|uniref:Uncharacterized protein n=1 Tax=Rarobacter incanus TaxID=153494 RepID=A0A542SMZ4_9MICO|nr:hypothetical protein FB389_0516 [Rarobacter incanus]